MKEEKTNPDADALSDEQLDTVSGGVSIPVSDDGNNLEVKKAPDPELGVEPVPKFSIDVRVDPVIAGDNIGAPGHDIA